MTKHIVLMASTLVCIAIGAAFESITSFYFDRTSFIVSNYTHVLAFIGGILFAEFYGLFYQCNSTQDFMIQLLTKYNIFRYESTLNYDKLSVETPRRPSTKLMAHDTVYRMIPKKTNSKTTNDEWQQHYSRFRQQLKNFTQSNNKIPKWFSKNKHLFLEKITIKNNSNNNSNNNDTLTGILQKYPSNNDTANGIIYYIHGGGFCAGTADMGFNAKLVLSQYTGYNIFSIEYQLAPENSLKQIVNECLEGYKFILQSLKQISTTKGKTSRKKSMKNLKYRNINTHNNKECVNTDNPSVNQNVIIMGDSAGGALVLLLLKKIIANKMVQPLSIVLISAMTDLSLNTALNTEQKQHIDDACWKVSPAMVTSLIIDKNDLIVCDNDYNKVLELEEYQPIKGDFWINVKCRMFIYASSNEVLINDSKLIMNKCKQHKIDFQSYIDPFGTPHAAPMWAIGDKFPEARDALIIIAHWLNKKIKESKL